MNKFGADTHVWLGPTDRCAIRLPGYGVLRVKLEGPLKWQRLTGDTTAFNSPAIGVNGNIHIGGEDGLVYTFTAAGAPFWTRVTGVRIHVSRRRHRDGRHGWYQNSFSSWPEHAPV